jgi:phospholipase/carboxylesterase
MEPVALWRRPAKRGATTPLLILLHGRGADEHDLIGLASELPAHFAYASLRAPLAFPGAGYRWFEDRGPGRPVPESLQSAVEGIRAWADGPDTAEFARDRTFVLGFSQGMMTAGALILDDPRRFAGAVLLSGAFALDTGAATDGRLASLPLFVAHGTFDTVIPPERVVQTLEYLRERSGAELAEHAYPIDHSISRREIADIAAWLEERG